MADATDSANWSGKHRGRTHAEKLADWLFQQGTSTVLLCLILGFMAYERTYVTPERDAQYSANWQRARDEFREALKEVTAAYKADQERDSMLRDELVRRLFERGVRLDGQSGETGRGLSKAEGSTGAKEF